MKKLYSLLFFLSIATTSSYAQKLLDNLTAPSQILDLEESLVFATFSGDGKTLIGVSQNTLIPYNLVAPYNMGNAQKLADVSFSGVRDIAFSPDGYFLFYTSSDVPNTIYKRQLSIKYDITSNVGVDAAFDFSDLARLNTTYLIFSFSSDGTKLVLASINRYLLQIDLETPFDLNTATAATTLDSEDRITTSNLGNIQGLTFSSDGNKAFLSNKNRRIFEYHLSTPYDFSITSRSHLGNKVLSDIPVNDTRDIILVNDQEIFVIDRNQQNMNKYTLEELTIDAKVFIQGAYNVTNHNMDDILRAVDVLDTTSPYADGATVAATVFDDTSSNDNIVDWVYVELRDENDMSNVLRATSALVQKDGDIVGLDGTTDLAFAIPSGDYFVSITHRNHLGITTTGTVSLSLSASAVLDVTTDTSLVKGGSNALKELETGIYGMIAGDSNADNATNTLDVAGTIVKALENLIAGYYIEDLNLDGLVNDTDKNLAKTTVGKAVQE